MGCDRCWQLRRRVLREDSDMKGVLGVSAMVW